MDCMMLHAAQHSSCRTAWQRRWASRGDTPPPSKHPQKCFTLGRVVLSTSGACMPDSILTVGLRPCSAAATVCVALHTEDKLPEHHCQKATLQLAPPHAWRKCQAFLQQRTLHRPAHCAGAWGLPCWGAIIPCSNTPGTMRGGCHPATHTFFSRQQTSSARHTLACITAWQPAMFISAQVSVRTRTHFLQSLTSPSTLRAACVGQRARGTTAAPAPPDACVSTEAQRTPCERPVQS